MTNSTNKPTTGFWLIGVAALIWNLLGVMSYIMQAYMTEEALAALPENEQALYTDLPAWVTAAFAIAVFGGALGCVFMLLRKKLAVRLFQFSLIGIMVQMTYNLFMSNAAEVYGPGGVIMPIMVLIIGFFLVWYAGNAVKKGILS